LQRGLEFPGIARAAGQEPSARCYSWLIPRILPKTSLDCETQSPVLGIWDSPRKSCPGRMPKGGPFPVSPRGIACCVSGTKQMLALSRSDGLRETGWNSNQPFFLSGHFWIGLRLGWVRDCGASRSKRRNSLSARRHNVKSEKYDRSEYGGFIRCCGPFSEHRGYGNHEGRKASVALSQFRQRRDFNRGWRLSAASDSGAAVIRSQLLRGLNTCIQGRDAPHASPDSC
jgi:hypothetical protein